MFSIFLLNCRGIFSGTGLVSIFILMGVLVLGEFYDFRLSLVFLGIRVIFR